MGRSRASQNPKRNYTPIRIGKTEKKIEKIRFLQAQYKRRKCEQEDIEKHNKQEQEKPQHLFWKHGGKKRNSMT